MKSYKTLAVLLGSASVAMLAACANKQTATEANFGASVRQMIEAQTYDPSTLTAPSTETIDSSDGRRLEAVLETYRTDVAKPAAVNADVSVDGQR